MPSSQVYAGWITGTVAASNWVLLGLAQTLGGADTANCAQGGMNAALAESSVMCSPDDVNLFAVLGVLTQHCSCCGLCSRVSAEH